MISVAAILSIQKITMDQESASSFTSKLAGLSISGENIKGRQSGRLSQSIMGKKKLRSQSAMSKLSGLSSKTREIDKENIKTDAEEKVIVQKKPLEKKKVEKPIKVVRIEEKDEINGTDKAMYHKALESMQKRQLLTDDAISLGLDALCSSQSSKTFYVHPQIYSEIQMTNNTQESVQALVSLFKKHFTQRPLMRRLLIPVGDNIHWCLISIDFEHKTISHFDSLDRKCKSARSLLLLLKPALKCLHEENLLLRLVGEGEDAGKKWKHSNVECVKQDNEIDCGVFLWYFSKCVVEESHDKVTEIDIAVERDAMRRLIESKGPKNLLEQLTQ